MVADRTFTAEQVQALADVMALVWKNWKNFISKGWGSMTGLQAAFGEPDDVMFEDYPEGTIRLEVGYLDHEHERRNNWIFIGPDGNVLDAYEPL